MNTTIPDDRTDAIASAYAYKKSERRKRREWLNALKFGAELWVMSNNGKYRSATFVATRGELRMVIAWSDGLHRGKLAIVGKIRVQKDRQVY